MTDEELGHISIGKKGKMMLPDPVYCENAGCTFFKTKENSEREHHMCVNPDMAGKLIVVKTEKGCPYRNKRYYRGRR